MRPEKAEQLTAEKREGMSWRNCKLAIEVHPRSMADTASVLQTIREQEAACVQKFESFDLLLLL